MIGVIWQLISEASLLIGENQRFSDKYAKFIRNIKFTYPN